MNFTGAHILSIEQFERADIEVLFGTADNMEPYAQRRRITRVLEGAILYTSNKTINPRDKIITN